MLNRAMFVLAGVCGLALLAEVAFAQKSGSGGVAGAGIPPLRGVPVVTSGLVRPLYVVGAPGDTNRLFIVQKGGQVRTYLMNTSTLLATNFLSLPVGGTNSLNDERGLLGMAFHPNYQQNGFFYVQYYSTTGVTVVERYKVSANPSVADPASAATIITIPQPFTNHNAGWIDFGPDGYLYIPLGDGGSANDPNANGQNANTLLGSLLRINVNGADGIPGNDDDDGILGNGSVGGYTSPSDNPFAAGGGRAEAWAIGLRNPYRASFDRATGALYIGDVGQGAREEINYQAPHLIGSAIGQPGYQGGKNYGWRCTEGTFCTGLSGCVCGGPSLTPPVHEYNHSLGVAVIGGYVYRGCAIPALQGTYFFADFASSRIWSFSYNGSAVTNFVERTVELAPVGGPSISAISSFGQDTRGELYIVGHNGTVFRIEPVTPALVGDLNGDGVVNGLDLGILLINWSIPSGVAGCGGSIPCCSDLNASGGVDGLDLGILLGNWTI